MASSYNSLFHGRSTARAFSLALGRVHWSAPRRRHANPRLGLPPPQSQCSAAAPLQRHENQRRRAGGSGGAGDGPHVGGEGRVEEVGVVEVEVAPVAPAGAPRVAHDPPARVGI